MLLAADSLATSLFIVLDIPHADDLVDGADDRRDPAVRRDPAEDDRGRHGDRRALRLAPVSTGHARPDAAHRFLCHRRPGPLVRRHPHVGPYVTEETSRRWSTSASSRTCSKKDERELIHSIIEFGDTIVREVMTPRPDMVTVSVTSSPRRALDLVIAEGYSKLPVYDETIDNVIGVVHDRELLIALSIAPSRDVAALAHAPGDAGAGEQAHLRALARDAGGKYSLAIVLDEYGGTAGLVTMEDLLEEIVGEIPDEHDEGEEEPIAASTSTKQWSRPAPTSRTSTTRSASRCRTKSSRPSAASRSASSAACRAR